MISAKRPTARAGSTHCGVSNVQDHQHRPLRRLPGRHQGLRASGALPGRDGHRDLRGPLPRPEDGSDGGEGSRPRPLRAVGPQQVLRAGGGGPARDGLQGLPDRDRGGGGRRGPGRR